MSINQNIPRLTTALWFSLSDVNQSEYTVADPSVTFVVAVGLSIDVWIAYIDFMINNEKPQQEIRE